MHVGAWQYADGVEPGFDQRGPMGDGKFGGAEAVAVAAFGVEVEFGRDFELLEGLCVEENVFYVDWVVFGLEEEGGWSRGAGVDALGELCERGRFGEVGGVDADDEVGAGIDGGLRCGCAGTAEVGVIAEDDDEMASGGEAERADAVRVEVPFVGIRACDAHGLLRVLEVAGVFGELLFGGDAIFYEGAVDSDGVEPGAGFGAFKVVGEDAVTSSRED